MPKKISKPELDAVIAVVSCHPGGVGVEGIRGGLPFPLPPRTLQRRMKRVEDDGWITSTGSGKGKRYFPVARSGRATSQEMLVPITESDSGDAGLYLSAAAREIRALITRPLSKRRPVGYDASFLASYQPNTTFYLPAATRRRLAALGQVGITDLPAGTYLRQILDRLLIDLAWNSSRLEGNTYNEC